MAEYHKIVVKIGTSTIIATQEPEDYITKNGAKVNIELMRNLVAELARLHQSGYELAIVSSGAIGLGRTQFEPSDRRDYGTIPMKQALAAIGQGLLMQLYSQLFGEHGIVVAQVLLTRADISDRRRYLNARNALSTLIRSRIIPIVNENDTVATEEIKIGDNDNLSALVASLLGADLLINLSDVDGLYRIDPHQHCGHVERIDVVTKIDEELAKLASDASSVWTTGGMITKLQAAKIATSSGTTMVIAASSHNNVITRIVNKEHLGTIFLPSTTKLESRKRWIAYGLNASGKLRVDKGAKEAIMVANKSLLPVGILGVDGEFDIGDKVAVLDESNTRIACGLVNYSAHEIAKIKGLHTDQIEQILGYKYYDEVIHKDNLVIEV